MRTISAFMRVLSILVLVALVSHARAQQAASPPGTQPASSAPAPGTPSAAASPLPKYPPFAEVTKDAQAIDGLIKLHQKGTRLFAEIGGQHFNRDFIVLISIARGIGRGALLGGMSWGFGDDWIWQFRKVDDRIHIVRKNVRFKASPGSPEERAVGLAYTDSVLFSLPIVTMSPSGAYVVELTPVFMGDLPRISSALPGFMFSETKSTWAAVRGFPDNVELQVAATYVSSGSQDIESVADSRGATINVHYSISLLPQSGYQPRLADDRVGYFLTVQKDYSRKVDDDRFVRFINRWDLRKADPAAEVSPPVKPIIFWLEKTIPYAYRKTIRDGILEWNKAFEKAGFSNAIEVRQQPDNADWDPEDINYNTFRWITSSAGFAMGPSRVNPYTGQILDADVIFDSDFLQFWKQEYETFTPASIAAMTGGPLDLKSYALQSAHDHTAHGHARGHSCECELYQGLSRELAFGAAVLSSRTETPAEREKMILQGLKDVTMHEIGHTLGLRHNFKASSYLSLEDINNPEKTKDTGLGASVMDYTPTNLMPKGVKQGDYFSSTIGPYDMWAIEYGYKSVGGGTEGEVTELKKIAARGTDPALAFATDEDARGIDPDPLSNRFDMGKDPIAYAKTRAQLVSELWPKLVDDVTKDGDGYQRARRAFGVLLTNYGRAMYMASRMVGGVYVNRSHRGDPNAKPPLVIVEPARQREALAMLEEQVFSDKPFQFPPDLYNFLAASRWQHWGSDVPLRPDYPAHEVIGMWQDRILMQLLSPLTLRRLHDSEMKVSAEQEAFSTPELLSRLTKTVFIEVEKAPEGDFTIRKPAISSLRRNLQRMYLRRLAQLALGESRSFDRANVPWTTAAKWGEDLEFTSYEAPQDCQTLAYAELAGLGDKITAVLKANVKLDAYTRAHLEETASRIRKVLEARLELSGP